MVILVFGINKPLSCRVVLVGSSPQKAGFLVHNWSVTLAEARADNDRSRVYLPQPPSIWINASHCQALRATLTFQPFMLNRDDRRQG